MAENEVIASVLASLDEDMSKVRASGLVKKGALCKRPSVESPVSVNGYDPSLFFSRR